MIHLEKHTKTHENGNIEFNGLDIGVTHLPETGAVSFHARESWKETFQIQRTLYSTWNAATRKLMLCFLVKLNIENFFVEMTTCYVITSQFELNE